MAVLQLPSLFKSLISNKPIFFLRLVRKVVCIGIEFKVKVDVVFLHG